MAKLNSLTTYMYDAAPSVALRTKADPAITANTTGASLALDKALGYWNAPLFLLADQSFAVVVNVDEIDTTVTESEATIGVDFTDGDAFTVTTDAGSVTITAGTDFEEGGTPALTAAALAAALEDTDLFSSVESAGPVVTVTALGVIEFEDVDASYDTDVTTTDGSTYAIALEVGPAGFATSIKPLTVYPTKTGQLVLPVDVDTLKMMKADADSVRLAFTVAGEQPSIKVHSWIAGSIIR